MQIRQWMLNYLILMKKLMKNLSKNVQMKHQLQKINQIIQIINPIIPQLRTKVIYNNLMNRINLKRNTKSQLL